MSQQQQTIYTIHESQLNGGGNNNNGGQQRQQDILIDTSSIPVTQQAVMPPMQHQHHLLPSVHGDTITSQPLGGGGGQGNQGSARVAPESQNVVYSVHPVFNLLERHDALLVRQRADPASTCCGFESANSYTVRSKDGAPILKAIENSNCCERCCFEGNREYNLSLMQGDEVVARIRKPYRVSRLCCYSNAVRIESPEDNPVGHVRQLFNLFGHPRYAIYDCQQPPNAPTFYLEPTSCRFCCTPLLCTCVCPNNQFRIVSRETRELVGTIERRWATTASNGDQQQKSSNPEEPFNGLRDDSSSQQGGGFPSMEDQTFGVQFTSTNLEARHKVLLLSACFMMDFFYFENDRRRRKLASC